MQLTDEATIKDVDPAISIANRVKSTLQPQFIEIEKKTFEPPHDKTNNMTVRPAKT